MTELSSSHSVGRKNYRCDWCAEQIKVKEKHWKRSYVYEGEFKTGRMHLECEISMNTYPAKDELRIDGWERGDFKRGEKWV